MNSGNEKLPQGFLHLCGGFVLQKKSIFAAKISHYNETEEDDHNEHSLIPPVHPCLHRPRWRGDCDGTQLAPGTC